MAAGQAAELGRLFYTPEERAVLDIHHTLAVPASTVPDETGKPAAAVALKLNGVITTGHGKGTVWVNDLPQRPDQAAAGGLAVKIAPDNPGSPVVAMPDGRHVRLKVGQSLHGNQITDVYERPPAVSPPPTGADGK